MRPTRVAFPKPDDGILVSGGLIVIGLLWLFVSGGTVPAGIFWPAVIGGAGVIVIWLQVDERSETATPRGSIWQRLTRGGGAMSIVRLVGGLVLVVAGISMILATQVGIAQLPGVLGASAVLIAGLLVVAAPWLYQQRARVRRAEADRLRAEARASPYGFPEEVTAFRPEMAVHGRFGKPCPDCGAPVQRIVYAENETNYCARCQTGGVVLADRSLSRLLKASWPRSIDEQG